MQCNLSGPRAGFDWLAPVSQRHAFSGQPFKNVGFFYYLVYLVYLVEACL